MTALSNSPLTKEERTVFVERATLWAPQPADVVVQANVAGNMVLLYEATVVALEAELVAEKANIDRLLAYREGVEGLPPGTIPRHSAASSPVPPEKQ